MRSGGHENKTGRLRTRGRELRTGVDDEQKPTHFRHSARWRSGYAEDCKATVTRQKSSLFRDVAIPFGASSCAERICATANFYARCCRGRGRAVGVVVSFLEPLISFDAITPDELNACLVAWGHKMGPLNRPSYREGRAHGLRYDGKLVAVTATEQMIPAATAGLSRDEALELARVCAARPDLCRVAVRLWREFVFPAVSRSWGMDWAISYQDAVEHTGNLYRHDGWVRLGFSASGSDLRALGGKRKGRKKIIWGWHADPEVRAAARAREADVQWPKWATERKAA